MAPRVFLITGTSTGFGHELAKVCLAAGDKVVATARNSSRLSSSFPDSTPDNLLLVDLDVTKRNSIDAAFQAAVDHFGRIDVCVNNAGFGLGGEFEGLAEEQIRMQMEVNFFGVVNVTRKAMETMRDLKTGGVIQQVTSIGGQRGAPGFSMYSASKWAVEGFTEAISKEVKPEWGIKFTCIEPGGFKTDWAGRSMEFGTRHPAYDHMDVKDFTAKQGANMPGDPKKGVKVFHDLAVMPEPPLRCIVGTDAYESIIAKLDEYSENVKRFKDVSCSTDFDGYEKGSRDRAGW